MKYKVGDIVKLRDDLEHNKFYGGTGYDKGMDIMRNEPVEINCVFGKNYRVFDKCNERWLLTDEMIEGLWEEKQVTMKYKIGDRFRYKDGYNTYRIISCDEEAGKYITVEEKQVGSRAFDVCEEKNMFLEESKEKQYKLKLIDVLNMIANGELKEGTKIIWKVKECWGDIEYTYKDGDLEREVCGETIYVYDEMFSRHLKDEVELIEPNDFGKSDKMAKHNHFADDGKMAETNQFREDTKMIETTDNTKIEGLTYSDFWEWDAWSEGTDEEEFVGVETATKILFDKLNEVIIYINKENNNE